LAAHKKLAVSCHFAIFLSPVNFDFHFILFLVPDFPLTFYSLFTQILKHISLSRHFRAASGSKLAF